MKSVDDMQAAELARLLDVGSQDVWPPSDQAAALRHQLKAPIGEDLILYGWNDADVRTLLSDRPPNHSFESELTSSNPSLALLQAIKDFAKRIQSDKDNPLHGAARVLYFAAVARAKVHCKSEISSLTSRQLYEGFSWSLRHPGTETIGHVFQQVLDQLEVEGFTP